MIPIFMFNSQIGTATARFFQRVLQLRPAMTAIDREDIVEQAAMPSAEAICFGVLRLSQLKHRDLYYPVVRRELRS